MLINITLTIIITILNLIFNTISPIFPTIDTETIYEFINKFFDIVVIGLDGFHFIMGDLPFILAPIILTIYLFYYTVFIPLRFVIKTFFN